MPIRCATARPERRFGQPWHKAIGLCLLLALCTTETFSAGTDQCRPTSGESLSAILEREAACVRETSFAVHLGRLLNEAGRYQDAADRLEGALLRAPDDWQTQLEYAIALAGSGDPQGAAALLRHLLAHSAIDLPTRGEIAALLGRRLPTLVTARPRLQVGLAAGYDDNLLGRTTQSRFELTLPFGRLPVQVDAAQRPRGGRYLRGEVQLQGAMSYGDAWTGNYGVFVSQRESLDYAPADLSHLALQIEGWHPATGSWAALLAQQIWQGGATLMRQWQVSGGLQKQWLVADTSCLARGGVELRPYAYADFPSLDGQYRGLVGELRCPVPQWEVRLHLGQDNPLDERRPGGKQDQWSLQIGKAYTVEGGTILAADFAYQWRRDASGYSPLLENNVRRTVQRATARLEYRWAVKGLSPFVGFEWVEQRSNLPLFGLRNRVIGAGIRAAW